MTKEHIALHKRLLFAVPSTTPSLKTYAIVDSARDESLKDKVMLSGLNYVDLWHEDLWELELERPLYLVELKKDNTFTDDILSHHHNSIATYLISPYALEALSTYYRKFTWVNLEEEQGKYEEAIFGFYDPNVLPDYVNSLHNKEKIAEFFMGTAMWLMPHIEKEEILYLAFRDKEGKVEDVSIDLTPLEDKPLPSLDFERVSLPNTPNLEVYAHEIRIEYAQLQLMEEMDRKKFVEEILVQAKKDTYLFHGDEKANKVKALKALDEAEHLVGIEAEDRKNLQRYVLFALLVSRPLREWSLYEKLIEASKMEKETLLKDALWSLTKKRRREDGFSS
jgi:hypothetical protein